MSIKNDSLPAKAHTLIKSTSGRRMIRTIVDVEWLIDHKQYIVLQNEAYQREEVCSEEFCEQLFKTIIENDYANIPEIHVNIELDDDNNVTKIEVLDGQQRLTALLKILNGDVKVPKNVVSRLSKYVGKTWDDVKKDAELKDSILHYDLGVVFYKNLSTAEKSYLFTEVLNNVNKMFPQEIRNAVDGAYSRYIRKLSRKTINGKNNKNLHELFSRITEDVKSGKKTVEKTTLKYFSPTFKLKGRMEVDSFLSEMAYFLLVGFKSGISESVHTKWVKGIQTGTDKTYKFHEKFTKSKVVEDALKKMLELNKEAISIGRRSTLSPMVSQMLYLFHDELCSGSRKLITSKYVKKFFQVYDDWSSDKKLYRDHKCVVKKDADMPKMSELFGGKNANAIQTIFWILNSEVIKDPKSFGIIELDSKSFSKSDIEQKWRDQDGKCFYTGKEIDVDDAVGDHIIPRSNGIEAGGVTEYSNLAVTTAEINLLKLNKSFNEFIQQLLNENIINNQRFTILSEIGKSL